MRNAVVGLVAGCLWATSSAGAHEFIVRPTSTTAKAGDTLHLTVLSSHVFMASEELEVEKDVRVGVAADGKRTEAPVKADAAAFTYEGVVQAPHDGTFIVYGTRLPQVWATTPEGVKPATKRTPGASNAFSMAKFSKAVINAKAGDDGYATVVGDPLEIVLLTNPAQVKAGDEVTVKVLYKGQPLTTNVYATYDGFSKEENTYAFFAEGKGDGTAKVKVHHPGLWMVRVQNATPERTEDYDRVLTRAVLLFEVK